MNDLIDKLRGFYAPGCIVLDHPRRLMEEAADRLEELGVENSEQARILGGYAD